MNNPTTTESDSPAWKREFQKFTNGKLWALYAEPPQVQDFISEQVVKKIGQEIEALKEPIESGDLHQAGFNGAINTVQQLLSKWQ